MQNLQKRHKWTTRERNVSVGDIVLVNDADTHRNDWSLGCIEEVTESSDCKERRAKVKACKEGNVKSYDRPISSLVLLLKRREEQQ